MPRDIDTIRLPYNADRRRKITAEVKERIRKEYIPYIVSLRFLASKYSISKRAVQFILNPEAEKKCKEQFKERRKDGRYYNSEANTKAARSIRKYKKEIFPPIKIYQYCLQCGKLYQLRSIKHSFCSRQCRRYFNNQ